MTFAWPLGAAESTLEFYDLSHPWGHGAPAWPYFEDVQIERLHGMAKSPAPTSTRRRTWWKEHRFWTRSR